MISAASLVSLIRLIITTTAAAPAGSRSLPCSCPLKGKSTGTHKSQHIILERNISKVHYMTNQLFFMLKEKCGKIYIPHIAKSCW